MSGPRETIRTFRSEAEAHLARSTLDAQGIPATVHRFSRYRAMSGGGYLLKVAACDAREARAILGEPDTEVDMDEYVDSDDASYRRCPACNSVNVKAHPLPHNRALLSVFTLGLALAFLKRDWHCTKCGHEWRG